MSAERTGGRSRNDVDDERENGETAVVSLLAAAMAAAEAICEGPVKENHQGAKKPEGKTDRAMQLDDGDVGDDVSGSEIWR